MKEGLEFLLWGGRGWDSPIPRSLSFRRSVPASNWIYDIMDDLIVLAHTSELIDKPTCEGTAGKRAAFIVHWTYFFDSIAHNVVSFTTIGQDLVVQIAPQNIHVSVVKTNRVRRPSELQLVHQQ